MMFTCCLSNSSKFKFATALAASLSLTLAVGESAEAMAIRGDSAFTTNTLVRNDDGSTGAVNIGFDANFFGTTYEQLYVNNNGNVTFDSSLSTFTPFSLLTTSTPIIAPFFADVDTRGTANGSLPVTYGQSTVDSRNAFGVNWVDVGYFASQTNPLNSFQLVLIDRSDIGAGDFDFEFNYDQILWETGAASGGTAGLGGSSARAGYSNGSSVNFELAGSAVNGALLDNGPNSLVDGSLGSSVTGRYLFQVRNGQVIEPPSQEVPTPAILPGIIGMGMAAFRKRKQASSVDA